MLNTEANQGQPRALILARRVMSKTISIIVVIALVVAVAAAAVIAITSRTPQSKPYRDGTLIDANATVGILWEEDGDPAELARRIIDLASGKHMSPIQFYQIRALAAGMFEEIRGMGMDIELLKAQVKQLKKQLAAK